MINQWGTVEDILMIIDGYRGYTFADMLWKDSGDAKEKQSKNTEAPG